MTVRGSHPLWQGGQGTYPSRTREDRVRHLRRRPAAPQQVFSSWSRLRKENRRQRRLAWGRSCRIIEEANNTGNILTGRHAGVRIRLGRNVQTALASDTPPMRLPAEPTAARGLSKRPGGPQRTDAQRVRGRDGCLAACNRTAKKGNRPQQHGGRLPVAASGEFPVHGFASYRLGRKHGRENMLFFWTGAILR